MSRLTVNYFYNAALTVSSYAINLILFPYVARVLGVDGLGQTGFVSDCVHYFVIFAVLGIATVGTREIAACGDNMEKRSAVFSSLTSLLMITTGIVLTVYLLSCFFLPRFCQNQELFLIGTAMLLSQSFVIEWFFQGIENFRYITIRALAIKLLYVVAVFLFVKSKGDVVMYFALTALMLLSNTVVNLWCSRRYVRFSFRLASIGKFLKPVLLVGAYAVMVSMYTSFTAIFLGFVADDAEQGAYQAAKKLLYLILGAFTAFTAVMFPRISSLLAEEKHDEYNNKIAHSFELVFAVAIPIVIYVEVFAVDIIRILSGPEFGSAVLPLRIVMPVLLLSAMAQIWIMQVLFPMRKDWVVLVGSIIGAVSGVVLSVLLIRPYGAEGTAWVLLLSEIIGNVFGFTYALVKGLFRFPFRVLGKSLLSSVPYLLLCLLVNWTIGNMWLRIGLSLLLCGVWFLTCHFVVLKESFISVQFRSILSRSRS